MLFCVWNELQTAFFQTSAYMSMRLEKIFLTIISRTLNALLLVFTMLWSHMFCLGDKCYDTIFKIYNKILTIFFDHMQLWVIATSNNVKKCRNSL